MNRELSAAVKEDARSGCQADSSAVPGAEDGKLKAAGYKGGPASLYYMKQTISNACGTIGVLHVIGNNSDRASLGAAKPEQPLHACAASCDSSQSCLTACCVLWPLRATSNLLQSEAVLCVQRRVRSSSASSARHRACHPRSAAGTWRTRRRTPPTWTRRTTCGPNPHPTPQSLSPFLTPRRRSLHACIHTGAPCPGAPVFSEALVPPLTAAEQLHMSVMGIFSKPVATQCSLHGPIKLLASHYVSPPVSASSVCAGSGCRTGGRHSTAACGGGGQPAFCGACGARRQVPCPRLYLRRLQHAACLVVGEGFAPTRCKQGGLSGGCCLHGVPARPHVRCNARPPRMHIAYKHLVRAMIFSMSEPQHTLECELHGQQGP